MVNIVAYSIKSDANFGRAGEEFVLHVSRFTVACYLFFLAVCMHIIIFYMAFLSKCGPLS